MIVQKHWWQLRQEKINKYIFIINHQTYFDKLNNINDINHYLLNLSRQLIKQDC